MGSDAAERGSDVAETEVGEKLLDFGQDFTTAGADGFNALDHHRAVQSDT